MVNIEFVHTFVLVDQDEQVTWWEDEMLKWPVAEKKNSFKEPSKEYMKSIDYLI